MIKVSIIVPVYNAEKYLTKCLDSILAQTLKEIEVICVDDGSSDHSGKILDDYALQDQRIKVFHRENRGYGAAVNVGLDMAAGEYIGIIESDDCVMPDMYQTLYLEAISDDLDVVKSDAFFWFENLNYQKRIHFKHMDPYYDKVLYDIDRNLFFDFYMNIWTGIYKREFLLCRGICFHESTGASYQDNGFWLQTLIYCKNVKWLNKAFYLYRQDNENSSVRSKDNMLAMTKEYEYIEELLIERKDCQYLPYCWYYRLLRHKGNFLRIADAYKREFCEQIQKDYIKYKGYLKGLGGLEAWMRNIYFEPDEFCKNAIEMRQNISRQLSKAGSLIIYGAGYRGDRVFRGLYNEGYYDDIACFAVTEDLSKDKMAGKEIIKIDDAVIRYPGALVIVAVIRGSRMYKQMVQKLLGLGITEYLAGSDIEENFYIL